MNGLPMFTRRAAVVANKKILEALRAPEAAAVIAMPVRDAGFAETRRQQSLPGRYVSKRRPSRAPASLAGLRRRSRLYLDRGAGHEG
jgi:hypothetical protein